MYTEEVNKIALNSSDNKILQTFDGIITYPYGTGAFKVCETKISVFNKQKRKYRLKHFSDPKAFIEYSNDMQDVYKNINDYNPKK